MSVTGSMLLPSRETGTPASKPMTSPLGASWPMTPPGKAASGSEVQGSSVSRPPTLVPHMPSLME